MVRGGLEVKGGGLEVKYLLSPVSDIYNIIQHRSDP